MNNRGIFSNWTEGILLTLAFLTIFGIVLASMNLLYDKNYETGITAGNGTEQLFITYQDTASDKIKGGEVEFDASQGITLKSSYGIMTDVVGIIWSFLTGGFITQIVETWNLGASAMALATAIRVIYFLSLIFAILYALFKVAL